MLCADAYSMGFALYPAESLSADTIPLRMRRLLDLFTGRSQAPAPGRWSREQNSAQDAEQFLDFTRYEV
jgi:hypothetical protein